MQEVQNKGAAEVGRLVGEGEVDPLELTEWLLEAIDNSPVGEEIYARTTPERAMAEAKAASARVQAGTRLGPLDGVPISWKDLFDTAGTATEAGTRLIKGRTPEADAEVLTHATQRGLICLGKTHLSEIAFSGLGLNPVTGTPPCINDPEAVAGGSSSGAAASVAHGLAAAAVGSDTGGSVRIPAAWNDLVGLKTTHGLLSLSGVVPLCAAFDTVGPLTRTVEDAALMLAAMGDGRPVDLTDVSLKGARIAVVDTIAMDALEEGPALAFQGALDRLEAAGATIEQISFAPLTEAFEMAGILFTAEAFAEWGARIEANPDVMFHQIRRRVMPGAEVRASDYLRAWLRLREIRAEWAAALASFDAVAAPTSPIMPPRIDRLLSDDDYYQSRNLLALRNTRVGNLMGLCSLTLPTGVPSCGIMLNGHAGQEGRLLRLGAAAEAALG